MAKSKSKLSQEILKKLLIGGAFLIAAQSPHFWIKVYENLLTGKPILGEKKKIRDTFYYLKRRGMIRIEKRNKQIYISLTKKGEKRAGKYQINSLSIKSPRKWDKKWRVVIFDIPENTRIKREAFRGKLKELNFYPLQKSVWAYPYSCQKEIKLLREFFNLSKENLKFLEVAKIEGDENLRRYFEL